MIITATVSAMALLYFFADARTARYFPRCPLHTFTGIYCPGCGSQRAFSSLLHGDVMQAFGFNMLLMISLPFVCYSAFITLHNAFSIKQLKQNIFYSPIFAKIVIVIVLLFWIARNISVYPFSMLAPG